MKLIEKLVQAVTPYLKHTDQCNKICLMADFAKWCGKNPNANWVDEFSKRQLKSLECTCGLHQIERAFQSALEQEMIPDERLVEILAESQKKVMPYLKDFSTEDIVAMIKLGDLSNQSALAALKQLNAELSTK